MMHTTATDTETAFGPGRTRDFERIESALTWLAEARERRPSLEQAAHAAGMSPFHFQRTFSRWAGVTPKQFLQHLGVSEAKQRLSAGASVLEASLDAGFSGPGRLHDALVRIEAVTPGEFRSGLAGTTLHHGVCDSPFGEVLLLLAPRGICGMSFVRGHDVDAALSRMRARAPEATLVRDDQRCAAVVRQVFRQGVTGPGPLRAFLSGTRFQVQVWRALLDLPPGALCSYASLARRIGNPRAVRAVGTAVGANPVAVLIPCHRVIRSSGALGDYHWGRGRKLALLGHETLQHRIS
jgi:AraC family transcriptional regulator of adaptative response/methylated-DNA-[protein]-cysteine methyltransferase